MENKNVTFFFDFFELDLSLSSYTNCQKDYVFFCMTINSSPVQQSKKVKLHSCSPLVSLRTYQLFDIKHHFLPFSQKQKKQLFFFGGATGDFLFLETFLLSENPTNQQALPTKLSWESGWLVG